MTNRDNPFHAHGSQGQKPNDGLDFQTGGNPKQQEFDYHWYHVIEKVKDFNAEFTRLDSNDDGIVDEADAAQSASTDFDLDGNAIEDSAGSLTLSGDSQVDGGLRVNNQGTPSSGAGIEFAYQSSNSRGLVFGYDRDSGNHVETKLVGDPIVMRDEGSGYVEVENADLRLATGQSIEDGGGDRRLQAASNTTWLYAYSDHDVGFWDDEGGQQALKYTTDASTGTLELTNANLDVNGNLINMSDGQVQNIGRLQYTEPSWPSDDNMDITAVGSDPPELVVRHYDFDGGGTEDIATFKGGSNTKLQFEGGRLDMNGNAIVDSNTGKVEFFDTVQASWFNATSGGPSGTGILNFSNTSLFEDNGEVVGRDSNGNTTQLT